MLFVSLNSEKLTIHIFLPSKNWQKGSLYFYNHLHHKNLQNRKFKGSLRVWTPSQIFLKFKTNFEILSCI